MLKQLGWRHNRGFRLLLHTLIFRFVTADVTAHPYVSLRVRAELGLFHCQMSFLPCIEKLNEGIILEL